MANQNRKQQLLKTIPGVDTLLGYFEHDPLDDTIPKSVIVSSIRLTIEIIRGQILENPETFQESALEMGSLITAIKKEITKAMAYNLRPTINATGVVVHTNLGRSLLSDKALANIQAIASGYSNLEFNLETGQRGIRYSAVEDILCELTGAEAAMVVNNNAGAVLLCLETLAGGKEVIVSRGELVEIGGAFRIPDVMEKSGGILKEVGTTNRTHFKDYDAAINDNTALLLKVHTSNYSVVGFTSSVSIRELSDLGKIHKIPVMDDLGSGTLIDFAPYKLTSEPTVQSSVAAGADIVTFSGDKLLGGPQAGIIAGRRDIISRIRKNPLTRALRIDKMTLAALESTLRLYRDEAKAVAEIPTLRMLTMTYEDIAQKAETLAYLLDDLKASGLHYQLMDLPSRAGGGSLPLLELPSRCVGITIDNLRVNILERQLRAYSPAIIGRIENDMFIIDPRTLQDGEMDTICRAMGDILSQLS